MFWILEKFWLKKQEISTDRLNNKIVYIAQKIYFSISTYCITNMLNKKIVCNVQKINQSISTSCKTNMLNKIK